MKLSRIFSLCTVAAALMLGVSGAIAQNDNGGDAGGGRRQGGGGGFGGGNFDPAQFQARIMERVRDNLGYTNDTDWNAVQPLVQKVMDARRDVGGFGGFGRGGNGARRNGGNGGGGENGGNARRNALMGQPSPESEALQKAVEDNAPASQIKDLLTKYQASQKAKQVKLEQAQSSLRKVLTVKQEASATLLGLLN